MVNEAELVEKYCSENQLKCSVRCPNFPKCKSIVLSADVASLHEETIELPNFAKDGEPEKVNFWWKVDDMYKFENIGFSKDVGTKKFLTCADCEIGPIGVHDTTKPKEFLVAISRVNYNPCE